MRHNYNSLIQKKEQEIILADNAKQIFEKIDRGRRASCHTTNVNIDFLCTVFGNLITI